MSKLGLYATDSLNEGATLAEYENDVALPYAARSRMQWVAFLPGLATAAISWLCGGLPFVTDISFIMLSFACAIFTCDELLNFSRRFGLGALVLYVGVLIWFCHDYFTNWFNYDFNSGMRLFGPDVISKAAFYHQLFVACASAGLQLPVWRRLENFMAAVPEPKSSSVYVVLLLIMFCVGMVPYAFFAVDPLPVAIWKDIVGGRAAGAGFLVGRSGSVNYAWGAYLAQCYDVGRAGAVLGVFYAMLLRPSLFVRVMCWAAWLLIVALSFGTGTRGEVALYCLPVLFISFLRYQVEAAALFRRFSLKAYWTSIVAVLVMLVAIQVQITYRNYGFSEISLSDVKTQVEGNTMFSEGLKGWALIPEQVEFLSNRFPGEGLVMAMPTTAWRFLYHPIPRALWTTKPIDPLWSWYNSVAAGRAIEETEGTTTSTGLVGDWYFRFGIAGVIEGGLLFGWLCSVFERGLLNSQGRLIQMLLSIGLLVFLFRSYRNFHPLNFYPIVIGVSFISIFLWCTGTAARKVSQKHFSEIE